MKCEYCGKCTNGEHYHVQCDREYEERLHDAECIGCGDVKVKECGRLCANCRRAADANNNIIQYRNYPGDE